MPILEMFLKDFGVGFQIIRRFLLSKNRKRIICFPHYPSRGATIYRIAKYLDFEITNKLSRGGSLAIFWEYATVRQEWQPLESLNVPVLNLNSRNISKDEVGRCMELAFGYTSTIDPTTFQGLAVKKSVTNAVHDGQEIICPCKPEDGFVYMKLIDTSNDLGEVMDMRVVIIKNQIPHIYTAFRPIGDKFTNVPYRAEFVTDVERYLSQEEQEQLLNFARVSGLDFGELDVLRDRNDQKIYVVDTNNTPQGPPKNLTVPEKKASIESLAKCFRNEFL